MERSRILRQKQLPFALVSSGSGGLRSCYLLVLQSVSATEEQPVLLV